MADDDSVSRRSANADRRTPRFSWNLQYEDTFFRSLCEAMQLGFKENHSFKAGAWERAAVALRDKHGQYPEKSHLINKADNARKKFRMWRGLREDPEFLYNPNTRMVTASEEAWKRHFEREPLSKALRGRPFDHEDYMEILFPDVIGSGGAPKRIMKKRRGPDGTPVPMDVPGNPGQAVMDLTIEPSLYTQTPTQNSAQQTTPSQHIPQLPTPTPNSQHPLPHPTSAGIPPLTSVASTSALTPPDETPHPAHSRKRSAPDSGSASALASSFSERRRGRPSRFASSLYNGTPPANTPNPSSLPFPPPPPLPTPARSHPLHPSFNTPALVEDGLYILADALKARNPPKWPEQAMEIFFRDFSDEDADLQLKIAEKALTDENKAMVFVKSTPELRRHWVGRLREVHLRGLGLGRVGEEAS
ncbi:Myb/SANT-like DNA-binding domain-containing protein [Xylariales sp. AK1849]|nr:Myb/SANT-like DNA-binding domain-containing protein [Xylariales sp. AK1849]